MGLTYELARLISWIKLSLAKHMQYAYIIIHSNLSVIILGILEDRGGLISAKPDRIRGIMKMLVFFNYIGAAPVIRDIFLVSRPGRRVFWNLRKFQKIVSKSSYGGFYILSTPYGITPHDDCLIGIRKSKYAGEVLLKVIYNTARQKPTILCR